jgi:hypothetical protein
VGRSKGEFVRQSEPAFEVLLSSQTTAFINERVLDIIEKVGACGWAPASKRRSCNIRGPGKKFCHLATAPGRYTAYKHGRQFWQIMLYQAEHLRKVERSILKHQHLRYETTDDTDPVVTVCDDL